MSDKLGFKNYNKNSWYFGGRLTKKNFDEVVEFIDRCTGDTPTINTDEHTISFNSHPYSLSPDTTTAKPGDYIMRNVDGGGFGSITVVSPYAFKHQFSLRVRWGQLTFYSLTDVEYNILRAMMAGDTDFCYPYSYIEGYTKTDRKETKKAMSHLRELGIVGYYSGLMTEEGEVAGSGFGMPDATQQLFAELLMWRKQSKNGFEPDIEFTEKPGNWWVTNHDNNARISGPYTTSGDADRARTIIEKYSTNPTYWIERLPE